jgi:enolase
MKSTHLSCLEILDSRGNPTLHVTLTLDDGSTVSASVPSGASKGTHEAFELRDNDPKRYGGLGVLHAATNALSAYDVVKDKDVSKQREIDLALIDYDGSANKTRIGANAILAVSLVMLKAGAHSAHMPLYQYVQARMLEYFKKDIPYRLPTPLFNLIEGGAHADNGLDFQELHVIPTPYVDAASLLKQAPQTASHLRTQIQQGAEISHVLKKVLYDQGYATGLGDENGFEPAVGSEKDALNLVCEAVRQAGYKLTDEISLGIDAAANFFYDDATKQYILNKHKKQIAKQAMTSDQLHELYAFFLTNYPLLYLEDPFYEEDWDAFAALIADKDLPHIAYSGDDLTTTNPKRLHEAIDKKAITAMIVKPNQIGTMYETLQVINECMDHGILYIPSHRSGETIDSSITDIAVGTGARFLKAGAPERGERVAKYNRLLEIANEFEKQ